jgi:hypothetical protein
MAIAFFGYTHIPEFSRYTARRLVDGVQSRFPDKNRNWCAEKALSDLERDRQMR